MKKRTKIALSCIIGVFLFSGVGCAKINDLSGSIVSGVNEEWHKNEVEILMNSLYEEKCYSSNDGDYIYKIRLTYSKQSGEIDIDYKLNFSVFDDLETYFVFANGYKTEVEISHVAVGGDSITIPKDIVEANSLKKRNITEVWVRTID